MSYYVRVSNCPTLSLSWVFNCPVCNCPVSNCPGLVYGKGGNICMSYHIGMHHISLQRNLRYFSQVD